MHAFIHGLQQRRAEIVERIKELERYVQEIRQLNHELQHIDALLHIHTSNGRDRENFSRRSLYTDFIYDTSKKVPSGIARHIIALFVENNVPLPIYEIDQHLRTRDVEVSASGINTALRRNPEYFEQVERGKWRLKPRAIPSREPQETDSDAPQTAQSEAVGVG